MPIENSLAGIAVMDMVAAKAWYTRLFGREPDLQPMPGVAEWKFPRGGWVQVFEDAGRAGKSSVTLSVTDAEQVLADLEAADLLVGELATHEAVKIAIQHDPDGNQIVIAEPLTHGMGR